MELVTSKTKAIINRFTAPISIANQMSNTNSRSAHSSGGALEEERILLLACGYLRMMENKYNLPYPFPLGVVQILCPYFPRLYTFINRTSPNIKISQYGQKITLIKKYTFATIQFGEFFSSKTNIIYKFKLKQTFGGNGKCGIGFVSKEYNVFRQMKGWNNGIKGSICFYSNGDCSSYDGMINRNLNELQNKLLWKCGDEIIIRINPQIMKILLWNQTKDNLSNIDKIKIDKISENLNTTMVCLPLTFDKEFALTIEVGDDIQEFTMISQQVEYITDDFDKM